jgi:hypothetical protein
LVDGKVATVGPFVGKDINDPDVKKALGTKDGIIEASRAYFHRADYDIMYEYGMEWLIANSNAIHIEDDYSQWMMLPELEYAIYDMQNMVDQAPNYSEEFAENAELIGMRPQVSLIVSNDIDKKYGDFLNSNGSLIKYPTSAKSDNLKWYEKVNDKFFNPNKMTDLLLNNIHAQNCEYNEGIDRLAALLTHDPFIATAVCCFVRYFGAIDLKVLIAIRSVLLIFAKGLTFDLGNFLNTVTKSIYDDIFNRASAGVLSNINKLYDKMLEQILSWIDAESLDVLSKCLPIDGLLKFMLSSLTDIRANLDDLIDLLLNKCRVNLFALDSKIGILSEQKWAKTLYQIIDAIINVISTGNNCRITGNPLEDAPSKTLIDSILNNISRQQGALLYNSIYVGVTNGDINSTTKVPISQSYRPTNAVDGFVLTKTEKYGYNAATPTLRALLDEPTPFNTFGGDGFITKNGIKVDSINKNIDNKESYKMTVNSAINEKNMQSCFEEIDNSNLLKYVLGKIDV